MFGAIYLSVMCAQRPYAWVRVLAVSLALGAPGLVSHATRAATLQRRVVHVIDGDGLVLLVGERRLNVRLEHIDAPERGQPYGIASRQSLTGLCGG
jgi:endonuclease YncB( thermonuclease family)